MIFRLNLLMNSGRVGAFRGALWLHVLIILGAGAAVRWPLLALAPFFTTDSRCCYYHYAANQLLAGQPFDSDLHYPPGYAVFLASVLRVADLDTAAVTFVQHGLGLATGVLVYFLGRRLFGPLVGLAAALATVLDAELALYEHAVMTEALFTILLVGAIGLLVLGVARYPWQTATGFGLLLGLATLVRPVGLPLPLVLLLVPAAAPFGKRLQLTGMAVAGTALILLPVMLWNARTHGQFGLTASFQRSMLNPIEAAPHRLLAKRGSGDPLLGRVKATISHHPTSAWVGPYERVLERFHLSNAQLDPLLTRVARDFVLADPWAYLRHTLQQFAMHLTTSEGAVEVVGWSQREYALAGGAAALGVADYDAAADRATAQVFDAATRRLQYGSYAWVLVTLAVFGGTRYYGRSALLVAVILAITVVSAGTINGVVVRYRYPVTWAIYLLAAAGAAGLFGMLRAALAQWSVAGSQGTGGKDVRATDHRPRATGGVWPTIRRGQLPPLAALLITVAVLVTLAAGRSAFAQRSPVVRPLPTLGGSGPPLSAVLDAARASTLALDSRVPGNDGKEGPAPRTAVLLLAADQAVDVVGTVDERPDGQRDHTVLLALGQEVDGQRVTFVELRGSDGTIWDTTGWYGPLLVFHLNGGAVLSPRAAPLPLPPQLLRGDHLLLLAAATNESLDTPSFREVTLHFRDGRSHTYPIDTAPLPASQVASTPELTPEHWLASYAAPDARVAVIQREVAMFMAASVAPHAALQSIELPADDQAAIRKWLHAETLDRHGIQYVWVGNSLALKGEAAMAVLDSTRLRPVLLQVQPGECPVRWRGLFVVATAAAATDAPLVPLTIPHPLAAAELQGALRFGDGVAGPLAPGETTMVQLEVTNGSMQRWYGTCSSPAYPVGVAVETRRAPEAPWTLVGEALLTDDLPAGGTAMMAVEIVAPREVGRYELRARLVQRPDGVSPATPAVASLVVSD